MKWIAVLLCCAATVQAQELKPNHIATDVIGESVDEYIDNNPACAFLSNPEPSKIKPRQNQRTVLCVPFEDSSAWFKLEPNASYHGVPLKTIDAIFLDEDGLVSLAFAVKCSDYDQLKALLIREFQVPDQVSQFNGETITWDNGRSRIDLQRGDGDDFSYLLLNQDEYLWKSILLDVSNGDAGDTKVAAVHDEYMVLEDSENEQIKIKLAQFQNK